MKKVLAVLLIFIFNGIFTISPAFAENVMFNVETKKVHKVSCPHAQKCTKNCIKIDRKDAYHQGGKPCKTCGG